MHVTDLSAALYICISYKDLLAEHGNTHAQKSEDFFTTEFGKLCDLNSEEQEKKFTGKKLPLSDKSNCRE